MVRGTTFQMSAAYSRIARSEENQPTFAVFSTLARHQARRIVPERGNPSLRRGVGGEVGGDHEMVVAGQLVDQLAIAVRLVRREHARGHVRPAPPATPAVASIVSRAPGPRRRRSSTSSAVRPKMKMLSCADALADLDIGAVQRADGQRAVQRELHVAGAGRLHAGGRDLLGQVGGRDDRSRPG